MLTQYDAVILAGLHTDQVAAKTRTRFDLTKCVFAEDQVYEEAKRPSRLDILLEPVAEVVVSIRAFLSERGGQERQVFPGGSPNRTT